MNKARIPHPGVDLLCGIYLEFCNSRLEYLILGSIISFVEFRNKARMSQTQVDITCRICS